MRGSGDSRTADLFEVPEPPEPTGGALNYTQELRAVLTAALKSTPKTRYAVAAQMSELVGVDIAKTQLDAWTAESRTPWRFPFEYAAAFEVACETTALQQLLARKRGCQILVGKDALLAELGRIDQMKAELADREKAIRGFLRTNK